MKDFTLSDAVKVLHKNTEKNAGRYFSNATDALSIGIGLLYNGIEFPLYDSTMMRFRACRGAVLVLTHECDLDRANNKIFNNDVLIAPIISFEKFFEEIANKRTHDQVRGYLTDLAAGNISQLMYLPPWHDWKHGAIVYLNRLTHTHYNMFLRTDVTKIGALTGYGLNILHDRISNHLIRPKDDRLPQSWPPSNATPLNIEKATSRFARVVIYLRSLFLRH